MKLKIGIFLAIMVLVIIGCTAEQQPNLPAYPLQEADTTSAPAAKNTNSDRVQVVVEQMAFGPVNQEISVGDTVEWANKDTVDHTVTFDDGQLESKLPPGGTVSFTFSTAGIYTYYCAFHPQMQGMIIVG